MNWRTANRDYMRGRAANLAGQAFNSRENIDWQTGWEDTQADRCLDDYDGWPDDDDGGRAGE